VAPSIVMAVKLSSTQAAICRSASLPPWGRPEPAAADGHDRLAGGELDPGRGVGPDRGRDPVVAGALPQQRDQLGARRAASKQAVDAAARPAAGPSVHALTAGTDRRSVPSLVAVALACGAVALLGAVRVWKALPPFRNGPALVHDGSMWPRTRG
jgi:hypothetical protein